MDSTFDSLAYFQKLKDCGVPEEQARIQADALREALDNRLVTREYPREFMDIRLRELEGRLKYDLTIRLGGIVVACTTLLLALLPWILKH